MRLLSVGVLVAIVLTADLASPGVRPRKFCECPEHDPSPVSSASASGGAGYRLFAFNDAYQVPKTPLWCYTRAIWAQSVRSSGRFEWQTSRGTEINSGAIKESKDPCGAYHNHYESATRYSIGESSVRHGPVLESVTDLRLFYAAGDEFRPGLVERMTERIATLIGFPVNPGPATPPRMGVRVRSQLIGSAPPYEIEYRIQSLYSTALNLYESGGGPTLVQRYPWLFWEAAISLEFYKEMGAAQKVFLDGGATIAFRVKNVSRVDVAIGRLLILPSGVLPATGLAPTRGAMLEGMATAFRVVPDLVAPPGSPSGLTTQ